MTPEPELSFTAEYPGPPLQLRWLRGREALSTLYEFDLELEAPQGEALDLAALRALAHARARVDLDADGACLHGIVREVRTAGATHDGRPRYHAALVPTVWLAAQNRRYVVHQHKTALQLLEGVLHSLHLPLDEALAVRVARPLAPLAFVVQYGESDWRFVSRLLEREGLHYAFEHSAAGAFERLVVSDGHPAREPVRGADGQGLVPFAPDDGLQAPAVCVRAFSQHVRRAPRAVLVSDRSWSQPNALLEGASEVSPAGFGERAYFGEHVGSVSEARAQARLRAEAERAEAERCEGLLRCVDARAGRTFTLEGHPSGWPDGAYLLVALEHEAVRRGDALGDAGVPGGDPDGAPAPAPAARPHALESRFVAQRAEVPFHPPRSSPAPRIEGVLSAFIDGDAAGAAAPVDEHGRYTVVLPFDSAAEAGGRATCRLRLAQGSAGTGFAMHLPLHVGTEVLLAFEYGDPDRPYIVGALANPLAPSVVARENASQGVLRSRTGIVVEFEDDA